MDRQRLWKQSVTDEKRQKPIIGEVLTGHFDKLAEESEDLRQERRFEREARRNRRSRKMCGCSTICENCVEVCPKKNRANLSIRVPGMEKHQIIHVDYLCNECGNCRAYLTSIPAHRTLDKFTVFATEARYGK